MALYCSNLGILLYICILITSLINTISVVGSDGVKGEKIFGPTDTYEISK